MRKQIKHFIDHNKHFFHITEQRTLSKRHKEGRDFLLALAKLNDFPLLCMCVYIGPEEVIQDTGSSLVQEFLKCSSGQNPAIYCTMTIIIVIDPRLQALSNFNDVSAGWSRNQHTRNVNLGGIFPPFLKSRYYLDAIDELQVAQVSDSNEGLKLGQDKIISRMISQNLMFCIFFCSTSSLKNNASKI